MSRISADLISMENSADAIKRFPRYIEEVHDDVLHSYHTLDDMDLSDICAEIQNVLNVLSEIENEIFTASDKLHKIAELYRECENSIIDIVQDLPYNITSEKFLKEISSVKNTGYKDTFYDLNVYSGHLVQNEDWLENIIFDRRDNVE